MNEKSKYTPGPWFVKYPYDEDIGEAGVAAKSPSSGREIVCARVWGRDEEAATANARLIAAAPELLEALDECDTAFAVFNMCGDVPQTRAAVKKAWAKANEIIAKATGKPDKFAEANRDA